MSDSNNLRNVKDEDIDEALDEVVEQMNMQHRVKKNDFKYSKSIKNNGKPRFDANMNGNIPSNK